MATATVVNAWKDANYAYLAAVVAEGGSIGAVEYVTSTPLLDVNGNAKSVPTLKAELVANMTALRNAQRAAPASVAISGTVTV